MYKFTVEDLKIRLDKFLSEQLLEVEGKIISRGKIQKDIEAGSVKVNGKKVEEAKFTVRKDDKVEYKAVKEQEPGPVNIPLDTLYNNHGLLIIDKPAGLVVHPGAGFKGDSLAQALLYHFKDIHLVGEEGRSGIVHRIDKDTSGVMMVALTQEMYEHLKDAFEQRRVRKEYLALVRGKIDKPHGKIDLAVGKSKKDFRKYTTDQNDMVLEKPSLTEYWVQGYYTAENGDSLGGVDFYTLIRVKLHTGRTHQIRVHFSSLGYPLVGDQLYGGKKVMKLGLKRQFLHASKIEVQLPNQEWVEAESKLPADLQNILKKLKKV